MEKKIEYSNRVITIIWQPAMCQHSGVCVRTLPEVYNPKELLWIKIENETTKELISQVNRCLPGALSYKLGGEKKKDSYFLIRCQAIIRTLLLNLFSILLFPDITPR